MKKEVKIYEIVVDYDNDDMGMMRNSFVDYPAVEYTKFDFKKEEVLKTLAFTDDNSEQKFMSVSMVADTPIPRIDKTTGEEYGIVFSKKSINTIVNKFVMDGNINEVSFQHTDEIIKGVFLVEHFITKKGVVESPKFKNLPDGSWVTTYYVPDTELYNKLKNDESFNGFSIEISGELEEMFKKQESDDEIYFKIEQIIDSCMSDEEKQNKIKNILHIK